MSRRSAVEQIVIEEKTVGEAINKLVGAREKASAWHLKWAKFEGQEFLIFLFSKLAELRWIWNEITRQFSDKHQDYLKTFKDVYHEERVIEDTKKALQACEASMTKLRKQIETAQKKSDSVKLHSLDCEINSQADMKDFLLKKIEDHSEKMNKTKIEQVQKGLLLQAQSGIQYADQLKHMFITQLRIADCLGSSSIDHDGAVWQKITQSLMGLSDTLGLYPPPSGAVDPLPSPSESPHLQRKSTIESPIISPVPPQTSGPQTPTARKSFPFPNRPLPQEPFYDAMDPPRHPPPPPPHSQSFTGTHTSSITPNHTPTHGYQTKGKFYRSSSDLTPRRSAVPMQTLPHPHPHPHRSSFMILEESDPMIEPRLRSQSVGQSAKRKHSDSPSHSILNMGSTENLNGSKILHQNSDSSLSSYNDIPLGYEKVRHTGTETPGSWSDSGYADPIDALKSYYNSSVEGQQMGVTGDSPYQSLSEIQRVRQQQLERIEQSQNDPTYSRPFDCLVGLREPVKIKGDGRPGVPVALKPVNGPLDYPPLRNKMGIKKKGHHRMRQLTQRSSGSDETLSSSPSPEPRLHPLQRSHRSGSLDCLLQPANVPVVRVSDDKYHCVRQRVNSLGDLLSVGGRSPTPSDWTPSCSPQPSPIHAPIPTEVTRLQNGYARVVHPDLSRISSSQSQ